MRQLLQAQWVDELERVTLETAATLLGEGGWVAPPTVHVVCDELGEMPYAGSVRSRPFARGDDAAIAMARLGVFPALLGASRVVLAWEQEDLALALQRPDRLPSGLVVVDAPLTGGHVVRWHPMQIEPTGEVNAEGLPVAEPRWGRSATLPDWSLPGPMAELLALWRGMPEVGPRDVVGGYTAMVQAGYEVHWMPRPQGESPGAGPVWRRVLAPVL